jgi:hypothetical protein
MYTRRPITLPSLKSYLNSLSDREFAAISAGARRNEIDPEVLPVDDAMVYVAASFFREDYSTLAEDIHNLIMDDEGSDGYYLPRGGYDVIREWVRTVRPGARFIFPAAASAPVKKKPATGKKRPTSGGKRPAAAEAMRLLHSGKATSLQEAWDMVKGRLTPTPRLTPKKPATGKKKTTSAGKKKPTAAEAMHLFRSGQAKSLQEAWDMVRGIVYV